ncbi:hypothetical protein ACFSSC_02915 [Corynebacterium mendelii]|nr:hypothetical protein [Corynebacterium mendelii]
MLTATLRHRELTQEVCDIGDEVSEYIGNLAEAVADFDVELVEDCMAEFTAILAEARSDSRRVVSELTGLRRALVSGVRAGQLSAPVAAPGTGEVPAVDAVTEQELDDTFPLSSQPVSAGVFAANLDGRTETVVNRLEAIGDWVADRCVLASIDPEQASLPLVFSRTGQAVTTTVETWLSGVGYSNPVYCQTMRGSNPPEFLAERARIDAVVARVRARMNNRSAASGGLVS